MHKEVFDNIDLLIKMANSPLNIDEINTELISLKKSIRKKREEIEDLKSMMDDTRYFNASNELVDKNIEISLKNNLKRLNRKIKEIEETLENKKNEESNLFNNIKTLQQKLSDNEKYLQLLDQKVKDSNNKEYYRNLKNKEEENIKYLENELKLKEKNHEEVLKEVELTSQGLKENEAKYNSDNDKLKDILDNLKNPNAYIDLDLKSEDEKKLKGLEEELDTLEKRKIFLLTDANMIGSDAKELIAENDISSALTKIKELVTIVKSIPYMNINNKAILDEELEKKEMEREELSTLIDNKKYDKVDSDTLANRISHINKLLDKNSEKKDSYNNKINEIDEYINTTLGSTITSIEKEINDLTDTINEYYEFLKSSNNLKTKANLESALSKKEKEKGILDDILVSYKEELLNLINETNNIKKVFIDPLEKEEEKLEKEKNNLNRLSILDLNSKDVIEEEKDKNKLKEINEEIRAIKNSIKYDKNADEVYDSIEMMLVNFADEEDKNHDFKEPELVIPDLNIDVLAAEEKKEPEILEPLILEDEIESPSLSEPEFLKVVDMIPVETVEEP